MPDVDDMRTWTTAQKARFTAMTVPGGRFRGKAKISFFGGGMKWSDADARREWAAEIGDIANAGGASVVTPGPGDTDRGERSSDIPDGLRRELRAIDAGGFDAGTTERLKEEAFRRYFSN